MYECICVCDCVCRSIDCFWRLERSGVCVQDKTWSPRCWGSSSLTLRSILRVILFTSLLPSSESAISHQRCRHISASTALALPPTPATAASPLLPFLSPLFFIIDIITAAGATSEHRYQHRQQHDCASPLLRNSCSCCCCKYFEVFVGYKQITLGPYGESRVPAKFIARRDWLCWFCSCIFVWLGPGDKGQAAVVGGKRRSEGNWLFWPVTNTSVIHWRYPFWKSGSRQR